MSQSTNLSADLERELLSKLNKQKGKNTMNPVKTVLFSIFGLFLFILGVGSFSIVGSGQRGVVTHFGKVQNEVLDEGLHFKLPIVTSVHKISVRIQKTEDTAEAASKDLQKVSATFALNWHIDSKTVNNLYQQIGDEEAVAERIIAPAIAEVLKAATAKRTAEEILSKRLELKQEIDDMLIARLTKYDLIINDISLVNLNFTEAFNHAVEAKQIADQRAQQAGYEAVQAEKTATAQVNLAKGQAEAQRLQKLTITPEILQKMAIEKWDGKFPQYMGGSGSLPFINLNLKASKAAE